MNVSGKVFRLGIVLSASVALLAACGDRGQFKSRTYTPMEMQKEAERRAALANGGAAGPKAPTQNGDVAPDPGSNPAPTPATPDAPAAPVTPPNGAAPVAPVDQGKPADKAGDLGPGAAPKSFVEEIPAHDKFINENNAKIAAGIDQLAASVFKGITATVLFNPGDLKLEIQAQVQIGNDLRFLNITASTIEVSKEGKVTKLAPKLYENDQQTAKPVENVQTAGLVACKDEQCNEIQVRLQVVTESGAATAVLVLKNAAGNQFSVIANNVQEQLKSFQDVEADFPAPQIPSTVVNGDQSSNAAGKGNAVAAPAAAPSAGESTAQKTSEATAPLDVKVVEAAKADVPNVAKQAAADASPEAAAASTSAPVVKSNFIETSMANVPAAVTGQTTTTLDGVVKAIDNADADAAAAESTKNWQP